MAERICSQTPVFTINLRAEGQPCSILSYGAYLGSDRTTLISEADAGDHLEFFVVVKNTGTRIGKYKAKLVDTEVVVGGSVIDTEPDPLIDPEFTLAPNTTGRIYLNQGTIYTAMPAQSGGWKLRIDVYSY